MSSMSLQLMNPPRMVIVGGTLDENKEVLNHDEEMDFDDLLNKDLPKRVLAFTSKTLLQQLGNKMKTSVDGTFKSSCKLCGQMFVWMIKSKGYWIPAVFGWLPINLK